MDIKTMKETLDDALPFAVEVTYRKRKLHASFISESGQQFGIGITIGTHTDEEIAAEKIQEIVDNLTGTWSRANASKPKVIKESAEKTTEEE